MERHVISAVHSRAQPVNLVNEDSEGSDDVPLVKNHLRRIFVLDTENLCSISISEEMGPGEACVASHLS